MEFKLALLQQFVSAFLFQQKLFVCVWCRISMAFNPLHDWVLLTCLFMKSQKNYRVRAKPRAEQSPHGSPPGLLSLAFWGL